MTVVNNPKDLNVRNTIISIGNFDGVHLGHHMLLEHMKCLSQELAKPSVIITFFPPSRLLFQEGEFLTSQEEKLELLSHFGASATVIIPFTKAYSETPKEEFLASLKHLEPHTIIVGENFRFGNKRQGSLNDLSFLAKRLEVFNLKQLNGEPISSTRIRKLLKEAKVEEIEPLLGRSYAAMGHVIKGDQRGQKIGFPTANIHTPKAKALPRGVFAVTVQTDYGDFKGMANVGPRPSFPEGAPSLEVHVFDFDKSLYNTNVKVFFKHFLRTQRTFKDLKDLKAQLEQDKEQAKSLLI